MYNKVSLVVGAVRSNNMEIIDMKKKSVFVLLHGNVIKEVKGYACDVGLPEGYNATVHRNIDDPLQWTVTLDQCGFALSSRRKTRKSAIEIAKDVVVSKFKGNKSYVDTCIRTFGILLKKRKASRDLLVKELQA